MKIQNIFFSLTASCIAVLCLFACHKDTNTTTVVKVGCMDVHATNYDSTANQSGTCHYAIEAFTGKYALVDTLFFLRQTGATSYTPDTSVTYDTIAVSMASYDSIIFDTLIRNYSQYPNRYKIDLNTGYFSSSYSTDYTYSTERGTFSGNQLDYKTITTCTPSSYRNTSRHMVGAKIN